MSIYEFYKGCVRKARYQSRKSAKSAREVQVEKYPEFNFVSYRCEFCSYWHVGRSGKKEER